MSTKIATGVPGAGKSRYVATQVYDAIVNTDCVLITNMAFKLHPWMLGDKPQMGFLAYLQREKGETFNLENRIRFLTDEEAFEFYRHRRPGVSVEVKRDSKGKPEEMDYTEIQSDKLTNCLFVIDEFWKYAGARDWQTTGKAMADYLRQHRKCNDNVWLMAHNTDDIDSVVRRVIESTAECVNRGRMRFGWFKQPNIFTIRHYNGVPSGKAVPMNVENVKIDSEGICQIYDTSAGVGGLTGGTQADTKQKKKGLHWGWLVAIAILALLAVWKAPSLLRAVLNRGTRSKIQSLNATPQVTGSNSIPAVVPAVTNPPAITPSTFPSTIRPQGEVPFEKPLKPKDADDEVFIIGLLVHPTTKQVLLSLSDGNNYRASDPEVEIITKKHAIVNGKLYKWPSYKSTGKETAAPSPYAVPMVPRNVPQGTIAPMTRSVVPVQF